MPLPTRITSGFSICVEGLMKVFREINARISSGPELFLATPMGRVGGDRCGAEQVPGKFIGPRFAG